MRGLVASSPPVTWLAPGVGLLATELPWPELADQARRHPLHFVRHFCPILIAVPLALSAADLDRLERGARALLPLLDPTCSYSVQTRLVLPREGAKGWPYGRFDVNQRLAAILSSSGAPLNVRQPEQVLSVVCAPGPDPTPTAYLGLSRTVDNLSAWAGGERRFKRETGQISRAEFKLLEALEVFSLSLPAGGSALDLGAAPGGWTRVLRQHGLRVVAVDPADLHPRIVADPAVTHVRQTAQAFLSRPTSKRYGAILNDMRLEASESARLMARAAAWLEPGGLAIMTLKLPNRGVQRVVSQSLQILQKRFLLEGARQLFHNRHELTVALRRRPANRARVAEACCLSMAIAYSQKR